MVNSIETHARCILSTFWLRAFCFAFSMKESAFGIGIFRETGQVIVKCTSRRLVSFVRGHRFRPLRPNISPKFNSGVISIPHLGSDSLSLMGSPKIDRRSGRIDDTLKTNWFMNQLPISLIV